MTMPRTIEIKSLPILPSPQISIGRIPVIANLDMPTANTEYEYQVPAHTKKLLCQCRDGTAFRLAFEKSKVATSTPPYFSVRVNSVYYEDNLDTELGLIMYFAGAGTAKAIEIICWS